VKGVRGKPRVPLEVEGRFWQGIREGLRPGEAAELVGVSRGLGGRWFRDRGGVMPALGTHVRRRQLSLAERERIEDLCRDGLGVCAIARLVGRPASTISRELRRVGHDLKYARSPRLLYRARAAQQDADAQSRRPKPAKLATNLRLRREVQDRLSENHSPEQIARRLMADFPDDPSMWVSPETIYQALYVQGRGALKRELARHLRSGRVIRKPRRKEGERRGRIPGMINISDRPAEVADRAVPGHWEGDLIMGTVASNSAVGTLVERATRFVILLHLPDGHLSEHVAEAMAQAMAELPAHLRRSLTWDQGSEMTRHPLVAEATGLDIYFCDPHSPWQRGSNENTNGLLRQYLPKSTDLSFYGKGILDQIAAELNNRPRKTLNWATPAEALSQLLSHPPSVAITG
jgi:IS30 family transposase